MNILMAVVADTVMASTLNVCFREVKKGKLKTLL